MPHKLTIEDGLLCVEGGVSLTGVTIDMVTNMRGIYTILIELCEALDQCEELPEDVVLKRDQARALIAYIKKSKEFKNESGKC